jgi:tRNA modification GTPase
LRVLSGRLIELGARRALPGEFTARAYVNGRLDASQAEGVLSLVDAQNEASARQAARLTLGSHRQFLDDLTGRLTALLARIEAGIDFVEEEDVHFITPAEVCRSIEALRELIAGRADAALRESWGGKPHVALAGLPNAGKSTLFNALLGYERAIVSPVLGTTRDVLSAPVELRGVSIVLQDCAGLGATADELELAAHLAAEQATDRADLVLWVHDVTVAWDARETAACERVAPPRRVLVRSKCDLAREGHREAAPVGFAETVDVSAARGGGLDALRTVIAERLGDAGVASGGRSAPEELEGVDAGLRRAGAVASATGASGQDLVSPEIVALELRGVWDRLESARCGPPGERILEWIFTQFCIGK